MDKFSTTVYLFALAGLATLLSACAGQPAAPQAIAPASFTMEMSEFAFAPDTLEVQVGQEVTIELVNVGVLEHEIMFGREVVKTNQRPSGYSQDMFETGQVKPEVTGGVVETGTHSGGHGGEHQGFMVLLPTSGDRATLKFTVTQDMVGEWEMGCFEQEGVHYDAGMVGKFVVIP